MRKEEKKKRNNRRTNAEIDEKVMTELKKLVLEHGFGNVSMSALVKASNIEANVFYRRCGSMDKLYDKLAVECEFWINNTININDLSTLGPKKFFSETFKKLYIDLYQNGIMRKILLYELTVANTTTKRSAEMRDVMNLHLITFYEKLFEPTKINIKGITAILIGGIYYLMLHKECAKVCAIDFNTREGEKAFFEGIDFFTNAIFEKQETYERDKKMVARMLSDGVDKSDICKYMDIGKNDLKALLAGNGSIKK